VLAGFLSRSVFAVSCATMMCRSSRPDHRWYRSRRFLGAEIARCRIGGPGGYRNALIGKMRRRVVPWAEILRTGVREIESKRRGACKGDRAGETGDHHQSVQHRVSPHFPLHTRSRGIMPFSVVCLRAPPTLPASSSLHGENRCLERRLRTHRLLASQSSRFSRSIRKRSLVRAYQPRPCMRPIRRIFSVCT